MAIVTKDIREAKNLCCRTRRFAKELHNLKVAAHRAARRAARQAIRANREVVDVPRLTGWDII